MPSLLHTLLELGHSTSLNLGFAQQSDSGIHYYEETITESNLLEIRRRHPDQVKLITFSKLQESRTTGADWEWHVIGRHFTLKMRVQAKRIYRGGGIGNLRQMAQKSKMPQIDLLISDAKANSLLPIYCFYCSEQQRTHWTARKFAGEALPVETGCLLANAHDVLSLMPKSLEEIERRSIPWHHICFRSGFSVEKFAYELRRATAPRHAESYLESLESIVETTYDNPSEKLLPTVADLNGTDLVLHDFDGVHPTAEDAFSEITLDDYEKRGIARLLKIDVRSPKIFAGTG